MIELQQGGQDTMEIKLIDIFVRLLEHFPEIPPFMGIWILALISLGLVFYSLVLVKQAIRSKQSMPKSFDRKED